MGKLGLGVSSSMKKQRPIERNSASYCERGGDCVGSIGESCNEAKAIAGTLDVDEYDVDDADDEESMLGGNEYSRQKPQHSEPSKKQIYLMLLIATTVFTCLLFYAAAPRLVDYFTEPNDKKVESSLHLHQQPEVEELPDTKGSSRNKERLDIVRRFDALQQKYKELQIKYKKAEEAYLKKLHRAVVEENLEKQDPEVKIANGFAESNELEIYKLEDIKKVHEDKSEKPVEVKKVAVQ